MTDQQIQHLMRFAHRLAFAICESRIDSTYPGNAARASRVNAALKEAEDIIDDMPLPADVDTAATEWVLQHNQSTRFLGQDPCNPSEPTYFKSRDHTLVYRFSSETDAKAAARSMNLWALLTAVQVRA